MRLEILDTTVQAESLSFVDLAEHYLTSPLSPARFRGPASPDLTLTFTVNGLDYEHFCDLVERLGWELVESRELAEESHGGWADVTITHRRTALQAEPYREYALGYHEEIS